MIVNETYQIQSCDDIELGIKRNSLLEFKLSYDDEANINAIVFITPGLGGDADSNYRQNLAEYVANEFKVAVVSTNYHCIGNRPQVGSTFYMDSIDKAILKSKCEEIGLVLDMDLNLLQDQTFTINTLTSINDKISQKKANGELNLDFLMQLAISVRPTKDEYQNFGLMQGMDLINALLFIKKQKPFKVNGGGYSTLPVVMIGSSHGAYVSLMAAKIAPWLVDAVIDNSAYAILPWESIGFGKEVDYTEYFCFCANNIFSNIKLFAFDKTLWTLNKNSPNYFSNAREEIRNILHKEALTAQAKYPKPIYISYHYINDHLARSSDKIELFRILNELGFDATLNIIKDENDVDGKFIKSLNHGMDMSIKTLINKELPPMLNKIYKRQKQDISDKSILYVVDDISYKFYEKDYKIELEIL